MNTELKMWSIVQSKEDYEKVIHRIEELSKNPPALQTNEGRELMLLGYLADHYEEAQFPVNHPDPIEAIKVRMKELGIVISDLLPVFGDRGTASKVLNKQRSLSLQMVRGLSEMLSLPVDLLIKSSKQKSAKSRDFTFQEPRARYKKKRSQ